MIKITSKVALQKSEVFAQPQNLFKTMQKFLYNFINFPMFWLLQKLLEYWRITSSFSLQWNILKFRHHLWWCSIVCETIAGSAFFVNYCIQRPFIENVTALIKIRHFFRRRFFGEKKWGRSWWLIRIKIRCFLEEVSLPSREKRWRRSHCLKWGKT